MGVFACAWGESVSVCGGRGSVRMCLCVLSTSMSYSSLSVFSCLLAVLYHVITLFIFVFHPPYPAQV